MGNEIVVAGASIFSFLMIYIFFKLGEHTESSEVTMMSDEKNNRYSNFLFVMFRLLTFGFFLLSLMILAGAILDGSQYCTVSVSNHTISNGTDIYSYSNVCFPNTKTDATSLFQLTHTYVFVILAFIVVSFFILLGEFFMNWYKGLHR